MDKYDAVKAASEALAILLATTACGAANPANSNSLPRQNNSAPSNTQPEPAMYVGIGATCTAYTLAGGRGAQPETFLRNPVMDRNNLLLPNGGRTSIFDCTQPGDRIPVTSCAPNNKSGLTCKKAGGGTIEGSTTSSPPGTPTHGYIRQPVGERPMQHYGAGWNTTRHS